MTMHQHDVGAAAGVVAPPPARLNPTRRVLLETFRLDARIVAGRGHRLFDSKGREYLDALAQYGALPFGHNPPDIWRALRQGEAESVASMIQPLRALDAEHLAEALAACAPHGLEYCVLANSGAETVEAAIKLARARTGRPVILSTLNGFHGKTLGAMSATGKPLYSAPFGGPAAGFEHVPYGDLGQLEDKLRRDGDRIAAFIVEPIQGEGGMVTPPRDYLAAALALCRRHGVLGVVDEIQTGLGRTGAMFATPMDSEPDMLLLAKGLGGGLMPIGAMLVRPDAWDDRFGMLHSSTFANNALAARVGLRVLDLLQAEGGRVVRHVETAGGYLFDRLNALVAAYPEVLRGVRGRGFMAGLDFHGFEDRDDSATMAFCSLNRGATPVFASYLFNVHGVLTAPMFNASRVLRIQPPFTVGRAEIDRIAEALEALCAALAARNYREVLAHLPGAAPLRAPGAPRRPLGVAVAEAQSRTPPEPNQFGFLIHYTQESDLVATDPSFAGFSVEERRAWLGWAQRLGPGFVRRLAPMRSAAGATAQGWVLSVPLLPEDMQGAGREDAAAMIGDAMTLAAERGLGRLGLGAFTSIATRGGASLTGKGVAISSGNTLTTLTAVSALEDAAARLGLDLRRASVAVVGATGAIGGLAARLLARRARRLVLVGNPANPFAPRLCARLGAELQADGGAEIAASTDLHAALAQADVVLVATNAAGALIDPARLRPGALVCDVARPPNVAGDAGRARHALVFDGGLVAPPVAVDLGAFQVTPRGTCWGCLGETLLLAFAGERVDSSIGGTLTLAEADRIAALAAAHGFRHAPLSWGGRTLDAADFARVAAHGAAWRG